MAREQQRPRKSPKVLRNDKSSYLKSKMHRFPKAQRWPRHNPTSKAQNITASSFSRMPVLIGATTDRTTESPREVSEINRRVSITGLFNRTAKNASKDNIRTTIKENHEDELILRLQDGFEIAYTALQTKSLKSLDSIRGIFDESIAAGHSSGKRLAELVSTAAEVLSTCLLDEQIEIEIVKSGNTVTETISVGERVLQFKQIVEKEGANLSEFWKQWEETQSEYIKLASDVFRTKAVPGDPSRAGGKTIESKNGANLNHDTGVRGLYQEIQNFHTTFKQKAMSSERELDASMKKERVKLMQTLIDEK